MSRTNPIALLLGIFFVACLGVTWLWTQRVSSAVQLWATWAVLLYGCVIGFYIWLHGLRCARLIHDVPLSKIGTAAQGYAELLGTACPHEDQKAKSIAGMPILWFRREIAERADNSGRNQFPFNVFYTPTDVQESETPFAIKDETGTACILPFGAEVICARNSVDYQDNRRITEEQIMEGDPLYVVGSFSTAITEFSFQDEYRALVEKWRNMGGNGSDLIQTTMVVSIRGSSWLSIKRRAPRLWSGNRRRWANARPMSFTNRVMAAYF